MSVDKFNSEGYYDPTAYEAISTVEKEERALRAFRPIVYICSPYAGEIKKNVKAAQEYSRFAVEKGYIPIAPHLLFPQFLNDANPKERQLGLFFGNALMSKCSEVWVFGSRISAGMEAEINRAKWKNYRLRYFTETCEEVLSNYTYTGNLILQKTFRENHITKKTVINNGELPKYHAEDAHDAIIDMGTFQAVQAEKARRAARFIKKPTPKKTYPFTSLLICDGCGKNYRRKVTKTGPVWVCGTFNSMGKAACASKQIPEETLQAVTAEVLGQVDFPEELLRRLIKSILVCNENVLIFRFYDGSEVTRKWQDRSRSQSWTDEMKATARQKALERRNQNA